MFDVSSGEEFRQLPNLPSEFGNSWMSNAHEILLPDELSWFPQTAAWTWLGILVAMMAICLVWSWWQSYQSRRYQRQALQRLEQWRVAERIASPEVLAGYPELLKQVAYCIWPREDLVSLSADDWRAFWRNTSVSTPPSLLPHLAYQSEHTLKALGSDECLQLWSWCREWVDGHRQFRHQTVAQLVQEKADSNESMVNSTLGSA